MRRQTGIGMTLRGSLGITEVGRAYVAEHEDAIGKLAKQDSAAVTREVRLAAAKLRHRVSPLSRLKPKGVPLISSAR